VGFTLQHALELLAAQPGSGHFRSDLTSDRTIRFWSVGPTLIAYRVRPGRIEILLIERGDRDWRRLLGRSS
jgi:plasmid stabilization system protein ParE